MTVDAQWAQRNLGIDPRDASPPEAEAATAAEDGAAIQRELIDFDSESQDLSAFAKAATGAASIGLSHFVDIPWPGGLAPNPGPRPKGAALPAADVLIVTWTVDEGHALSRVLTPGFDSQPPTPGNPAKPPMGYWKPYKKNYADIAADMRPGCPALNAKRLGTYWTTRIGPRRVTLFKSDSHMSQDGPKLPNATVWRQIIEDCRPDWVITTGTGGGIGPDSEVGDVLVSRFVTFDCQRQFVKLNAKSYACHDEAPDARFATASSLFSRNAKFLPSDNKHAPEIIHAPSAQAGVLTTDYFGFDNSDDTYKLTGKGGLSEMGDAVLGMVCKRMAANAPRYVMVRNVSDPQIDSSGLTLAQQTKLAADIYKAYGRWRHSVQRHRLLGHRRRPLSADARGHAAHMSSGAVHVVERHRACICTGSTRAGRCASSFQGSRFAARLVMHGGEDGGRRCPAESVLVAQNVSVQPSRLACSAV